GILGTPDFISPEQARDPRNVDIRADLYSLGCTFYHVLTGRLPFEGSTAVAKMLKHQWDHACPVNKHRADIPAVIVNVVQRLMAKKPEDRFQTPQELADALKVFLTSTSSPPTLPSRSVSTTLVTECPLVKPKPP